MVLKKYQQKVIDALNEYLLELKKVGPEYAFIKITEQPYKHAAFGKIPFICVKIPTGGGKTLVAAHTVSEIFETVLQNKLDKGIVMWFVPSEAIKSQTLRKLKDRNDIHRKALDDAFDNRVRIFSNDEALRIRKEDVGANLCIIISSLDAFRKEKTIQNKYKVYQENGELLSHFENIQDVEILEKDDAGTVTNSLANVIRKDKPLIIIDEGHHSQTELSIEFLKDLNPAFIIEFTATPRDDSNILVKTHSQDLKDEKMVKIPIILESVSQWQQAVTRGVLRRNELEALAKKEKGEYIRPIALLQAEQEKESDDKITVSKIKEHLLKEHKIPEEQIAIKTASTPGLDGIDLFDKKCPIRYIITVNALAEGWDCSFAYVLISVANIGAKISVEQIIGRIVRLPNLKLKTQQDLNYSYIFASARNFNEAANQIISGLEKNGYSRHDLVNISERGRKDECEVSRVVKEDLKVPIITLNDEPLDFSDLLGDDFVLAKQNHEFKFETHYDSDGRIKLDIKEGDQWVKERQTILNLIYEDKNFSKTELVSWLDKRLRFVMLDQPDKKKFVEKAIDYQLKKYSISDLSVNRFVLRDKLDEVIRALMQEYAKDRFGELKKKIAVKVFEKYADTITIAEKMPEKFKKNYYEDVEKLNKEELNFVERLDSEALPNIRYWVRNREKEDPFYIRGWRQNKFYPDFIAVTKKGNILALEWKGEDRVSNADTKYKEEIAEVWKQLGKGKLHFFLVHNGNIEEVLNKIKLL